MRFLKKIIEKIVAVFKQGISPHAMALSICMALAIGVIPLLGTSTVLITCTALWLRLNLPVMILVGYVAAPLQLALLLFFIKIGEWLFQAKHTLLTLADIQLAFSQNFFQAVQNMSFEILCALTGWSIFVIPFVLSGYLLLYFILKKMFKMKANPLDRNP